MQTPATLPSETDSLHPLTEPRPRAVTWRSVLLGLGGVVLINALVPYNDYVLENTFLIGNFLPIGVLLLVLALVLCVNAPLRRFAPSLSIREAELAVIMGMMLVGCAVPSSGLMRYLPSSIVGIYANAVNRPDYAALVASAHVPSWLLPTHVGDSPADIGNSDVFKYFYTRSPDGNVPYGAWIRPMLTWGAFIGLLWGMLVCLGVIVRRQWAENERLAFPLAMVYESLIQAPPPGRALNELFSARSFWIAAISVFVLHGLNSLHVYIADVPEIPLGYDFHSMFADDPWRFMSYGIKSADISFCMVGVAFFLQSSTAFSLWFFYLLWQIAAMLLGMQQQTITAPMMQDQTFGGLLVMSAMLLFVGREHWWMVIRHMFGRWRADEVESRYLPYPVAGWGLLLCFSGVVAWLMLVGMSIGGAIVITLIVVMMLMIIARVLAETGLVFIQTSFQAARAFSYPLVVPAQPMKMAVPTFFFASWFSELFHDLRESFPGFLLQSLRVADVSAYERSRKWRTSLPFILVIVLSLGTAYFTSWASMLKVEYSYANSLSLQPRTPLNQYGVDAAPKAQILDAGVNFSTESAREAHSALFHLGLGGGVVALCSILRLTTSWWPLNPIGYILMYSYAMEKGWFSIFLGWLAKVILVRLGGSSLLKAGKPVFIGLIVGEAVAAAFWLIVNLVLHLTGHEYRSILFLPGFIVPWH